ncbi:PREDICTED: transcription factor IIIB 70 kDa subunit-like [Fragaria vesca subsp. vesca]
MVFCNNCSKSVPGTEDSGRIWCDMCGKVLVYDIYSEEPTFFKDAAGQSKLSGNFVRGFQSEVSASRERLIDNARYELRCLRNGLEMGENEEITDIALRFYTMALERNFTRGRNTEQVLAACLYIACRTKRKPYLLIEFSNFLKIDVYTLGAVYMQLSKVLYLDEFPFASLPVDPSIFIAKFSESLPGGRNKGVTKTAVRIINSMKRNWMQVRIAHVCDATLTKRLIEFVNTDSGSLTIEEFHLKESEMEELCEEPNTAVKIDSGDDILCVHKDSGIPFAHGLCKLCYDDLMKISGGLRGGSDPPSFQRAEIERRKKASAQENPSESDVDMLPCQSVDNNQQSNFGREVNSSRDGGNGMLHSMENVGAPTENEAVHAGNESCDESDNLSDIDDVEVDEYLLDEEGKHNKKIIWEALNREYIEEQAAKAAMGTECPESQAAAAQKRKGQIFLFINFLGKATSSSSRREKCYSSSNCCRSCLQDAK